MKLTRRQSLSFFGATSLFSILPSSYLNAAMSSKYLILVELQGANDGLNTVIPYSNPYYYNLRPNIAIKKEEILTIEKNTGLHFSLSGLAQLYEKGELKIIQNLGYPQPVLSHFRSIELWETGGDGTSKGRDGWLIQSLNSISKKSKFDEHSSLSYCITGTSLSVPIPSKLFATVLAYQFPCDMMFLGPTPVSAPAVGLT